MTTRPTSGGRFVRDGDKLTPATDMPTTFGLDAPEAPSVETDDAVIGEVEPASQAKPKKGQKS